MADEAAVFDEDAQETAKVLEFHQPEADERRVRMEDMLVKRPRSGIWVQISSYFVFSRDEVLPNEIVRDYAVKSFTREAEVFQVIGIEEGTYILEKLRR